MVGKMAGRGRGDSQLIYPPARPRNTDELRPTQANHNQLRRIPTRKYQTQANPDQPTERHDAKLAFQQPCLE